MENIIITCIEKFSYFGVLFLIAIENIFPPIPSEVILAFSGFIAKPLNLSIPLLIISSTIGSIIGAITLYYFGNKLSDKLNASSSIKIFKEKGIISILICRFIPILRSLISIPAGMFKVNMFIFLSLTTIGSLIWNSVIILIGSLLGNKWENISSILTTYKYLLVIIFAIYIIIKIIKKYKKKKLLIEN